MTSWFAKTMSSPFFLFLFFFFWRCRSFLVKFSYWFKIHANIIACSGVMATFVYKGFDQKSGNWNNPRQSIVQYLQVNQKRKRCISLMGRSYSFSNDKRRKNYPDILNIISKKEDLMYAYLTWKRLFPCKCEFCFIFEAKPYNKS